MSSLAEKFFALDPKMIWEMATGLEEEVDVARRYGIDEEMWKVLALREDIQQAIEKAKAELAATGQTFRNKARLLSDSLLEDLFKVAIQPDTPAKDKVAALGLMAKLGELEPKSTLTAAGSGFSISITLPQVVQAEKHEVIDVDEKEATPDKIETVEFKLGEEVRAEQGGAGEGKDLLRDLPADGKDTGVRGGSE